MDIGSILVILALLVVVVIFVTRPFIDDKSTDRGKKVEEVQEHERSSLLAERDRILNALRELDFDHLLGKIPEEVYPQQRNYLLQKGVEVLKHLDGLHPGSPAITPRLDITQSVEKDTSNHILNPSIQPETGKPYHQPMNRPVNGSPDDEIEIMLANRRRARKEKAAGFCPKCGNPIQLSDHFCPKCGSKIIEFSK